MNAPVFTGAALAVGMTVLAIALVVTCLFLYNLMTCLQKVSAPNRAMDPGLVWLCLIPLFNLYWNFNVVLKVSESLTKEASTRRIDLGDGGKSIGIAMAVAYVCSIVPFINMLAGPASLICMILYWVKIAGFSKTLGAATAAA